MSSKYNDDSSSGNSQDNDKDASIGKNTDGQTTVSATNNILGDDDPRNHQGSHNTEMKASASEYAVPGYVYSRGNDEQHLNTSIYVNHILDNMQERRKEFSLNAVDTNKTSIIPLKKELSDLEENIAILTSTSNMTEDTVISEAENQGTLYGSDKTLKK